SCTLLESHGSVPKRREFRSLLPRTRNLTPATCGSDDPHWPDKTVVTGSVRVVLGYPQLCTAPSIVRDSCEASSRQSEVAIDTLSSREHARAVRAGGDGPPLSGNTPALKTAGRIWARVLC